MHFSFVGFSQEKEFRMFEFETIAPDRTRTRLTVEADLALIRRYAIGLQDLPLLCQGLLERRDEGDTAPTMALTEEEIGLYCRAARDTAAQEQKQKRFPTHRSPSDIIGTQSALTERP